MPTYVAACNPKIWKDFDQLYTSVSVGAPHATVSPLPFVPSRVDCC